MLAGNVPNNGSASVTLPNIGTHTARIEIQAVGNIFFDVSDSNFTITADQTISFGPIPDHTWGDADFTVSATASSGLPVSFTVGATDQCTISGNTVTITGAGSCSVTASQPGDGDLTNPAPDVTQTFNINKADQTIAFTSADHTFGDAGLLDQRNGHVRPQCRLLGDLGELHGDRHHGAHHRRRQLHGRGEPGRATPTRNAAPPVDRTFNINQASQTITFGSMANHTMGDPDFGLHATASSGLAVSYSASGGCSVTGSPSTSPAPARAPSPQTSRVTRTTTRRPTWCSRSTSQWGTRRSRSRSPPTSRWVRLISARQPPLRGCR